MNTFVTLLVLVVAAVVGPAAGRSTIGRALDLVDELQGLGVPGFGTAPFGEREATKLIEDMQFIFDSSRKGLQEKADEEQTAIDPQTLANLDMMEKLMPRVIRIVADMTSLDEANPSLEPALPDLTRHASAPAGVVRSGARRTAAPAPVVRSGTRRRTSAPASLGRSRAGHPAPLPAPASGASHFALPGGGYFYATKY